MCGLAGILDLRGERAVGRAELAAMVAPLQPRGPDGEGYYSEPGIGLGHARLSIIDLEGGAQPIHSPDRKVWTVFNGEIFNYIELRAELEKQGCAFYTHTDTEVIVHLYQRYGDDFVQHLNGQFAIAVWDEDRRRLVLTRDRPGIAPLFYTEDDGRLLFGSEIKSLLPVMHRSPAVNPAALDQLMTFWAPVSPNTMFEGVYEVSPGEQVIVENGQIRKRLYWDWTFPTHGDYHPEGEDVLAERLHDLLVDATQIRLRSDVPVGAYLSGGLDSSVLVSLIHHHGGVPLRTFSIGFEDRGLDESSYQQLMIDHLGADHSRIDCSYADVANRFESTIERTEMPILRTAPVPMGILSGLVRQQGYKVVLTGEGADEVLGGYDLFKESKIRQFWARQPDSAWRAGLLKRLYPYLDLKKQGVTYLRSFFGVGLDQPELPYFSHLPRWTTTAKVKEFFSDDFKAQLSAEPLEAMLGRLPEQIGQWHHFNRGQYIEAKSLMAGYLLSAQGDRQLLANSVEGRFPFLDHRVIEFANRLHPKWKMRGLNEKYLLKRAMQRYLPDSIRERHKQPYRAPDIAAFFGGKTPDYVHDLLSEASIDQAGYFDGRKVVRLLEKIRRGRAIGAKDNMALVGILSTQIWHQRFLEQAREGVASATA